MPTQRSNSRARSRLVPATEPLERIYRREVRRFDTYLRARLRATTTVRLDAAETPAEALRRIGREYPQSTEYGPAIDKVANRIVRDATRGVAAIAGIPTRQFVTDPTAQRFRETNLQLIRTVSQSHVQDLVTWVSANPVAGVSTDALAAEFQRIAGVSASRAKFWAVDQTLTFNSQVVQERSKVAGLTHYIWRAAGDERTRDIHRDDLDGNVYTWGNPPVTSETGARNHPGEDFNCRCIPEPTFPPTP